MAAIVVILVVIGAALMVAEAQLPTLGVLGAGAAAALTAGVVLAPSGSGIAGGAAVAAGVIVALAASALAWLLVRTSLSAHRMTVRSGSRALAGRVATVRTGLHAARGLARQRPDLRLLMLSMHDTELYCLQALKAGACGYHPPSDAQSVHQSR
jgi:membrane-bound ClpP family serine protease